MDNPTDLRDRTFNYARAIIRLFSILPQTTLAQTLGKQLLRSGTAIGANYREAYRSRSDIEFTAKLGECLKESDESSYWLDLLHSEKIIPASKLSRIRTETNELISIFVSSIKTIRAQQPKSARKHIPSS